MCVLFMRMEMAILWGAMVTNGKNRLSPWKKTRERHTKTELVHSAILNADSLQIEEEKN